MMTTVMTLRSELPNGAKYREQLKYHVITLLRDVLRGEHGKSLELDADENYHVFVLLDFLHDLHTPPTMPTARGEMSFIVWNYTAEEYAQRLSLAITGILQLLSQRDKLRLDPLTSLAITALLTLQRDLIPETETVGTQAG